MARNILPGAGGVAAPLLVRTATGQITTRTETFGIDPVANGQVGAPLGYNRGTGPVYDAAEQRLVLQDARPLPNLWAYTTGDSTVLDYQADLRLRSDDATIQHFGLWIQCGPQSAGDGIRLAHINTELSVSRYVGGNESAMTLTAGNRVVGGWPVGLRQLRLVWDFGAKTGTVYVDGQYVSTWSDPTSPFTGGRPGGFAYGCVVSWDDLVIQTPSPVQITGLGALQARPTQGGVFVPSGLPSTGQRIDVTTMQGAVQASAWMLPGDTWAYQGGQ